MAALRIELFGNLQITCDRQPVVQLNTNRLRSLLAWLVLHASTPQPREQLSYILWPESSESQARTNLRQLLHNLRRALPADLTLLAIDNQTVYWRRDPSCSVDVFEFESAVMRGAAARKQADASAERYALEEAARLYQDDLLRSLYDDWLQPKRDHYRREVDHVLTRLTALHEENRDLAAAIRCAERLVAHDPIREAHHRKLIGLHAANHDRAGALRAWHQCMRTLRRELGAEPSRETRALFDAAQKSAPQQVAAQVQVNASKPAQASSTVVVGRRQEWNRLIDCWGIVQRGETQVAFLLGEPGIGKTRLAEELRAWCAGKLAPTAHARCYAAQGQLAYAPVADWLRADALRALWGKLSQPQLTELARVLPEILVENPAIPRPGPLTESWQRHHFYDSLNAAFARAPKPLLLIIDDLQWCDQDSFEWMHAFFRREAAHGILLVATVRPEETGRDHPFTRLVTELRQAGQACELQLDPLTPEETAELAAQISDRDLAASDHAALYSATRGNPLFVLESVRGGFADSSVQQTPARIHAVLAARLAQLSPRAYELAGMASVIGCGFSFDLLAKATDWDEDSVSRALDELWQHRIIGGEGRSAELYDFTHDRLREAALADLTPVRRRFLHRRVARALQELYASDVASLSGRLAAHYESAGMAEQAIHHYQQAAAVARARYADAEAAGLLRRALALCREFPETARRDRQELELLVALGASLVTTQGYGMPDVGDTYLRALELARRTGEHKHLFAVLSGSWVFHTVRGRLETARAISEETLRLATGESPSGASLAGNFLMGNNSYHRGDFAAAASHFRAAIEAQSDHANPTLQRFEQSNLGLETFAGPDIRVFCRSYLSHVLWHTGSTEESARCSQDAVEVATALSHPFSIVLALNYEAMLRLYRRERAPALDCAQQSIEICRKHEFAYYRAMAEIIAAWAQSDAQHLRDAIDGLKATGAELRLPFYYGLLAETCEAAGRAGEGLANIATAFAFQNKNEEIWNAADLQRIEGDLLLATAGADQARVAWEHSLDTARRMGAQPYQLRAQERLSSLNAVPQNAFRTAPM